MLDDTTGIDRFWNTLAALAAVDASPKQSGVSATDALRHRRRSCNNACDEHSFVASSVILVMVCGALPLLMFLAAWCFSPEFLLNDITPD